MVESMHNSEAPRHCPQCGSPAPAGAGVLLCAVCVLTDAPEDEEEDGQRIGSYTLLDEIARGGMGVVYRARQEGLKRIVALKVLPGAAFASAEFRQRFQREAETAASLKHPGIVRVHEIGQALGQPFLSMDYIDGPSLAEKLAEQRLPVEFSVHLVREVARAVAHAHHHGVAHRDLKPSNILIGPDNAPVLTDFGLARFLDLESSLANAHDLIGSPPYLPPERIAATAGSNPVAEDVYGLGAVLYHCLTGRPPFMADSLTALLAAVAAGEPVPPRHLNPSVPLDLETICLKCMETSPAARYAAAAEVGDELDRFLRGEAIRARPPGPAGQLAKWVRRKPAMASLVLALLLAIVTGTAISLRGWQRASDSASDFQKLAEQRRVDLYSGNLAAAAAAMDAGNRQQARALLGACRPERSESDLRGYEWFLLERLLTPCELFSTGAHDHILTALAWSPAGDTLLSAAHDGSLVSWNLSDRRLVRAVEILAPGSPRIHQLAWTPDGSFIAAEGGRIRCRRLGESAPLWEIPGQQFSVAGNGCVLAVSTGMPFYYQPAGHASIWDFAKNQAPVLRQTLPFPARAVAISPDARWLAFGIPQLSHPDQESGGMLVDLALPDAPPRTFQTSGCVWSLAFAPDSTELVATTGAAEAELHRIDVVSGREKILPITHTARVWAAVFSPDSKSLLITSSDRSLGVLPLAGGPPTVLPLAHDNEIWAAAIHPSGQLAATGDKDGVLKLYPLPLPRTPVANLPRHPHFRYARPVFTADSSRLFVSETTPFWRTMQWDFSTGSVTPAATGSYPLGLDAAGTLVWRDPDAHQLKTQRGSLAPRGFALSPESWPAVASNLHHGLSPDARHYYQFSENGRAATVDLTTATIRQLQNFCHAPPIASAFSPGGRFLVAATWAELVVHDFSSGKTTRLPNDPHWARAIAFSPDGSLLATGGIDGHILLHRLPDLSILAKLSGHLSEVSGLAISPDGRTLVTAEIGTGLRFWRLDTRREVMRVALPTVTESLTFSPDGQSLAVTISPPSALPRDGQVVVIACPRAEK